MKFDLHLHTSRHSPDSVTDPFELLASAREHGLDGVVITEHDFLWTDDELAELRRAAPDLVILAGVEVTARGGDVLCYGVRDPYRLPRGISWPELCAEVWRQGGACAVAHPFRWGQPAADLVRKAGVRFDAVELMSNNMDEELMRLAAELHAAHPEWAGLGNSDSHAPDTVGLYFTEFSVPVRSNAELVAALRGRQTAAKPSGRVSRSGPEVPLLRG